MPIAKEDRELRISLKSRRGSRISGVNCKANTEYEISVDVEKTTINGNAVTFPILVIGNENISLFAYLNGYVDGKSFAEVQTSGKLAEILNTELDKLGDEVELGTLVDELNKALENKKFKCSVSKIVNALSRKCENYRFRYCEFDLAK